MILSNYYSFSEVTAGVVNGTYDTNSIPVGLRKNKEFGLINNLLEVDLADHFCEWGSKFTVQDMCELLRKRIRYVRNEISRTGKILLNLRDMSLAMSKHPERVLTI
jgi:hypothetical protein